MKIPWFLAHEAAVISLYPYDSNPYLPYLDEFIDSPFSITVPFHFKVHLHSYLTCVLVQVTHKKCLCISAETRRQTRPSHTCSYRCPLIAFVPYLPLIRLNPHRGLIHTFRSKHLLVFCFKTGVSCKPLVIILTPTILKGQ
ncbi:unnamed protein product [Hymenolepis diminuta]|uniref:Uncharacterized protein n=1 Tax=Hymenolepis diminuta TaxID=6216 RepID=A0A564Z0K2_HYMDI|nr:unnamed protein product [Hymenolepis diminuta]